MGDRLVWYVAYGSNMLAERFTCYLSGGRMPRGIRRYEGARNRQGPLADEAVHLPGTVYFAGSAGAWHPVGSGIAFYDPARPGPAAGRGWLITIEQFADVAAQENRGQAGDADHLLDVLSGEARQFVGGGPYGRLLRLDDLEGSPAWTLTCSDPMDAQALNRPGQDYLDALAAGLTQAHGWPASHARKVLADYPGARGNDAGRGRAKI